MNALWRAKHQLFAATKHYRSPTHPEVVRAHSIFHQILATASDDDKRLTRIEESKYHEEERQRKSALAEIEKERLGAIMRNMFALKQHF
jgi:hypothetical protein